jgi:alpha-beta hydrolase superfamily lysophospholipase
LKKQNITKKRFIWALTLGFVLINIVAFFHAYKFTHFVDANVTKTKSPEKLNSIDKIKTLLFGVNNPRPINKEKPAKYKDFQLQSNKRIDCWYLNTSDSAKGTVVLFHGYSSEKSSMLDKANEFEKLNYNILLVDFMGSGGSEGNQTTLGFKEAEEVKTAFDYLLKKGENNIYLFGTSMGSVAIMKAIFDYDLKPKGIIIECPFGSMYQTICARFKIMNVPSFPMAGLLVFWGAIQNNFWALGHDPTDYAKKINCPTLLLYGEQDTKVSRQEIDEIYKNLNGTKELKTYKLAGHEDYLLKYKDQWIDDIKKFLITSNKVFSPTVVD